MSTEYVAQATTSESCLPLIGHDRCRPARVSKQAGRCGPKELLSLLSLQFKLCLCKLVHLVELVVTARLGAAEVGLESVELFVQHRQHVPEGLVPGDQRPAIGHHRAELVDQMLQKCVAQQLKSGDRYPASVMIARQPLQHLGEQLGLLQMIDQHAERVHHVRAVRQQLLVDAHRTRRGAAGARKDWLGAGRTIERNILERGKLALKVWVFGKKSYLVSNY